MRRLPVALPLAVAKPGRTRWSDYAESSFRPTTVLVRGDFR